MAGRKRMGGRAAFSHREHVYQARDCFEIDEVEGYEVTRKRVFFDEVVLVTRHRFVPWASTILAGLLAGMLALVTFTTAELGRAVGFTFFGLTLALLIVTVLLVAVGGQAVTVQGKRTRARMDFVLRPSRAGEAYRLACRLTRERQQRIAREIAAGKPPSAPVAQAPEIAQREDTGP